jgi:hypothetical protein
MAVTQRESSRVCVTLCNGPTKILKRSDTLPMLGHRVRGYLNLKKTRLRGRGPVAKPRTGEEGHTRCLDQAYRAWDRDGWVMLRIT